MKMVNHRNNTVIDSKTISKKMNTNRPMIINSPRQDCSSTIYRNFEMSRILYDFNEYTTA